LPSATGGPGSGEPALPPAVRPATPDDHELVAEALALAFVDDPGWAHVLPAGDAAGRGERLLAFFNAELANLVPEWREVWVTEDGSGAAVWARPGRWRVPFARTLRAFPQMRRVFGRRLGLATWALLRIERLHPPGAGHYYLHYLGVLPERQGRGLGSALMRPVLERCDADGIEAFLESSTERSAALYARNGFSLTGTFDMPGSGPLIRQMLRGPQAFAAGADTGTDAGHGFSPAQARRS
jgi:GNAT superfamily N-acetyltransferase